MFDDTVKYFPKCCKLHISSKTEFFMILSYPSCKFDVHRYFCQLRSDRMGAVVIDYINTAHDAVKYCTNTPNRYELPWIKCLFIYTFLVIYWESNMGPYHRISVNYDHNAVKYCINTAKWHKWQKTEYFLAFLQFFLQFEFLYHRLG